MSSAPPPLALITGGEGGLACAICKHLERDGFEVLAPGRAELDVADAASVEAYFGRRDFSRLELLVNNAGVRRDRTTMKMSESEWDEVVGVNLRGAFLCSRAVVHGFSERGRGHIVNIGSYSALSGPVGQANYAAAKAGMIGLTKSLALEGGERGVRANCVLPGWLETKFTADIPSEISGRARSQHALGEFNTPDAAAEFVCFLHTRMKGVSGQVFQLDSRVGRWN